MLGQVALARLLPAVGVASGVAVASLLLGCRMLGRDGCRWLVSWRPDWHALYSVGGSLLAGWLGWNVVVARSVKRRTRSAATISHLAARARRAAHPVQAITNLLPSWRLPPHQRGTPVRPIVNPSSASPMRKGFEVVAVLVVVAGSFHAQPSVALLVACRDTI